MNTFMISVYYGRQEMESSPRLGLLQWSGAALHSAVANPWVSSRSFSEQSLAAPFYLSIDFLTALVSLSLSLSCWTASFSSASSIRDGGLPKYWKKAWEVLSSGWWEWLLIYQERSCWYFLSPETREVWLREASIASSLLDRFLRQYWLVT